MIFSEKKLRWCAFFASFLMLIPVKLLCIVLPTALDQIVFTIYKIFYFICWDIIYISFAYPTSFLHELRTLDEEGLEKCKAVRKKFILVTACLCMLDIIRNTILGIDYEVVSSMWTVLFVALIYMNRVMLLYYDKIPKAELKRGEWIGLFILPVIALLSGAAYLSVWLHAFGIL